MKFQGIFQDGGLLFGTPEQLKEYAAKHEGGKFNIVPYVPESPRQRKFYHGAVLPLWAFLNDWDYKDTDNLTFLHGEAKNEFNSEVMFLDGKKVKRGKSTKGALQEHIEKVILYLEEQYAIDRLKVLNPEHYRDFMDRVFMEGKYTDYIDYLIDLGILQKQVINLPPWRR